MLGNCLIRTPVGADKKLDFGVLCEALLFFSSTHVVLDPGTLKLFTEAGLLDDFIEMLERGYASASFMADTPGLFTQTVGGLREHNFTLFRITSDPTRGPILRPVDAMRLQLERSLGDKAMARGYVRRLSKLVSIKEPEEDAEAVKRAVTDLTDPAFAEKIARMSLEHLGVPAGEIGQFEVNVLPLDDSRFAIDTTLNFDRLRTFVLATEPQLGPNHLFPGVGDARLDIALAAHHNAAFIGNESNRHVVEMILSKAIGGAFLKVREVPRAVYDFISLDMPTIREVINSGERTPRDFIDLLSKAKPFKEWLNAQNPDKDVIRELLREQTKGGWLDTLPVKVARFGIFSGAGFLTDMVMPGSSVALGAVDNFLMDKLTNKWRPHFFVENRLRGFLDPSAR